MVLSKLNTGKYLTKEWNDPDRERQRCLYDQRQFSTADRTYYEVNGTGIHDGLGYMVDDAFANLIVQTVNPVDNPQKKLDHRTKPEVGF